MSIPLAGATDCTSGLAKRVYDAWTLDASGKGNGLVSPLTGAPQGNVQSLCYAIAKAISDELTADGIVPSGTMAPFAGGTAPTGWLLCNGQAVSRTTYAALFAAIGTTYGAGDGSTTFNVPDARGRALVGAGQGAGLTNRALAATGGEEAHALTAAEMPVHNHGVTDPGHGHQLQAAPGNALGTGYNITNGVTTMPLDATGVQALAKTTTTGISTQNAGSGTVHNTMPPFLAVNWIIAA